MAGIVQYWERKNWFNPHIRLRWIFWVMMAFKKTAWKRNIRPKIPSCPHFSCPGRWFPSPCSVQCSLLSCFFASVRKMLQSIHAQLWNRWLLYHLTENTNRRCSFQANGQKYPHLLSSCMATEVKGRCLPEPVVAALEDDELQTNLCKAPRDWSDRALSSWDPSNKLVSTSSWATFT